MLLLACLSLKKFNKDHFSSFFTHLFTIGGDLGEYIQVLQIYSHIDNQFNIYNYEMMFIGVTLAPSSKEHVIKISRLKRKDPK